MATLPIMAGDRNVVTLQIVDDDPRFLRVQARLLSRVECFHVVATSVTGQDALAAHFRDLPDVTLLDLEMPGISGTDVLRAILRRRPDAKVVILSAHATAQWARPALAHGAVGYIVKGAPLDDYVLAVRAALHGSSMIDQGVLQAVVSSRPAVVVAPGLHPRQQNVLSQLVDGRSVADVAVSLGVSRSTVKRDIGELFNFFGVRNRAQLVARATSPRA